MSIPEQIRALESLASIDAELKIIEEQLAEERGTLDALTASLKKFQDKVEADRASLTATDKARADLVIEVRSMNTQLEHSREKLGRARNERESNACQRELEELRKLLRDREEEIGKLTTEGEGTRQQIEATDAEVKKVTEQLDACKNEIASSMGTGEEGRSRKLVERAVAIKRLPPALYRKYEMIRGKRGFAIAQTTTGTCNACHMALPPQMFHQLRREPTLEQCASCNRIIYFVPPQGEGAPIDG